LTKTKAINTIVLQKVGDIAMNLHIMPAKSFLKLNVSPEHSAAIISTSSDIDEARISCPYILGEYIDFDYESPRSFSTEQASAFASFVKKLKRNTTDLYICCDAGESRSPAIAAAIHRWLAQNDAYIWETAKYHPNMFCFLHMLDALNLSITDEEVDALIQTNQSAFKNAVQQARLGGL